MTTQEILEAARAAKSALALADEQTRKQALWGMADWLCHPDQMQAILAANGLGFEDVIKTTCFLADMGDFAAFNAVYGKYFTGKPARSCVAVKELPKKLLCEVEIIAVCKK